MKSPPIDPQQFTTGVKVVDIGDLRVARGKSRRPGRVCEHGNMVYDSAERRIYCWDCESDVDPFDAFTAVADQWHIAHARHRRNVEQHDKLMKATLITRAAKAIDKAWRSKTMVPTCPSCQQGLFAEDFKLGADMVSREWAVKARMKRDAEPET